MPVETRTATGQAKSKKLKSQTSGQFIQDPGTLNQGDCRPRGTHDKMGFVFSEIAERFSPRTFTTHNSAGIRTPTNSCNEMLAPDLGEMTSRPGSTSSLTRATSNNDEHQSSLLWSYVSSRAENDGPESELPLKIRRLALCEEYWAHDSRVVVNVLTARASYKRKFLDALSRGCKTCFPFCPQESGGNIDMCVCDSFTFNTVPQTS